ncbi:hypothetical protein [Aquimarina mytili]|uniref:Thrombospondin type 3 repeat-containing protein n=1 Tax=Aquimarina mytili TaxID=874423 RepID=A0A937DAE9_9FLAO|nr:hypothetical protein [Aquimarina mytili]MBL0685945.1 hypothetical protein [Aquimarina mytili]
MKKLFYFLFSILVLLSCDDGDIIITSFEFDDVDLQLCEGAKKNEFVFFKINQTINEAISYNFISETYSDTIAIEAPISIELNNETNNLIYRQFSTSISADYYCSNIPPSNITITEELVGTSGTSEIFTEIIEEDDDDGIPAADEANVDTDNDGIPDFKDQDDDNDNILTSVELSNGIPDNDEPRNTDGDSLVDYLDPDDDNDGILTINEDFNNNGNPRDDDYDNDGTPDYLDNDDDDDGIPTIEEDTNGNGNPRDDDDDNDGIPNYLDTNSENDSNNPNGDISPSLDNTVQTTFRTTVTINRIIFSGSNQNFQDENFSFGFRDVTIPKTTKKM